MHRMNPEGIGFAEGEAAPPKEVAATVKAMKRLVNATGSVGV